MHYTVKKTDKPIWRPVDGCPSVHWAAFVTRKGEFKVVFRDEKSLTRKPKS